MNGEDIIAQLPYEAPFLFVDQLTTVQEDGIEGTYRFDENLWFYKGHFKNNPVTPGVILIETMAQIGVVCLGIFLVQLSGAATEQAQIGLSSTEVDFFIPILPNETVRVKSTKEYFRFNKLKCHVELFNEQGELACRGKIAGMFKLV